MSGVTGDASQASTDLGVELVGLSAKVRVPATSANLGPGYDSAGLALALFDDLEATILDSSELHIDIEGEGSDTLIRNGSHLVVRSLARGLAEFGVQTEGLKLHCVNRIPHGRGLGSSSAAIVGGLALAQELLRQVGLELTNQRLLELANDIEGHPDNVAPAIFGGFTIAWQGSPISSTDGDKGDVKVDVYTNVVHRAVQPVVAVPTETLATKRARELMPNKVPLADAAENAASATLLGLALTSDPNLLMPATSDRIHQYYRRFAYPDSYALMRSLRAAGVPAAISGAGPTVIAFGVADTDLDALAVAALAAEYGSDLEGEGSLEFSILALDVDSAGVASSL